MSPHILIKNKQNPFFEGYEETAEKLKKIKGVKAVIPQINSQSIIKFEGYAKGVLADGISPENVKNGLKLKMVSGSDNISELDSVLIGEEMAGELRVKVGQQVSLISAENKEIKLTVRGIFKTGFLEYDSNVAVVPLRAMQILAEQGEAVTEMDIKVESPQKVEEVLKEVITVMNQKEYTVISWKTLNHNLLKAVQFEKFVLIAILSLLLVIASFAVSVILNMIVREKIKDIGILKSIGYTNKNIRKIFTIEGLIIGVFGMIMASGLSPLVLIGLKILFKEYMKGGTYYLEELPLYISQKELLIIYGVTFVVVFLSTIFPAARAARLKPVEALKYE